MKNIDQLFQMALEVRQKAYAPYSNYYVGASILTRDGSVFSGCNVENASYGLTICAERNAIASAVASGQKEFESIAIVVEGELPARPCGACLQVIREFGSEIMVYLFNTQGKREIKRISELLPTPFSDFTVPPKK